MSNKKEKIGSLDKALRERLAQVENLRQLPFDDPSYEAWRVDTGHLLDQLYGQVESEQHPCTRAFLNYRIPDDYSATRSEMQDYYRNILGYQTDLLRMYLDEMQQVVDE